MANRLPANLVDSAGKPVSSSSIPRGVVGLYFSAHWCPPCRGFTPKLIQWYKNFHAVHPDQPLTLIFVSHDQSKEEFEEYHGSMNFHAIPFEDPARQTIANELGVMGIPTLIFFDADGQILTKEGRSVVAGDPNGDGAFLDLRCFNLAL